MAVGRGGEQGASVGLRTEPDRLHLSYSVRVGDGAWEEVADAVPLVRVPCRLGGARPYFLCPGAVDGIACGRRVTKLYAAGRHFRCRHCHRLAHASQGEDRWARRLRRANTVRERVIRERLGGAPGPLAPCPPKPKGMHLRTYARLLDQLLAAELLADQARARRLERLLARIDGSKWRDDDPEDGRDRADPPAETAG
jgi:hypothetical protein